MKLRNLFKIQNSKLKIVIVTLVILSLAGGYFFLRKPSSAEAAWWDNDWLYRVKITIDETKIDGDLSDFPVLIKLTSTELDFTKAQANGEDIRFTDHLGNSLDYEIEDWTQGSSTANVWVRIPQVTSDKDIYFYMYYGNATATDGQDANGVWDDDFKLVQHMNSTSWLDSTSNAVNGTASGDATTTTSGQIGTAGIFDGTGDYITMSSNPLKGKQQVTVSYWVKANDAVIASSGYFNDDTPGASLRSISIRRFTGGGYNNFCLEMDNSPCDVVSSTLANTTNWYYLVGVYDGSYERLYVNGLEEGTPLARTGNTYSSNSPLKINSNFSTTDFPGIIDEVRISNTARSAAWIKADYNSTNNTLLSFGAEQTGTGPALHLKFDEGYGTTAYDSSDGVKYNGTISGATWTDQGKYSKALIFDGTNDDVAVGDINENIKSVSMWIKPASASVTEYPIDLNGSAYVQITNGAVSAPGFSTPSIYVNGIQDAPIQAGRWNSIEITTATGIDASNVDVGEYGATYFKGTIDEVKLYPYQRTATQAKNNYNHGVGVSIGGDDSWITNGLVGYWKMDESSWDTTANQVVDSSGSGNHGTSAGNATTAGGKFGNAGTFDGTGDYVDLGDTGETSIKTVAMWVKPTAVNVTEEPLDLNGTSYVKITNGTVTGEGFTSPTVYVNGETGSAVTTSWNLVVITTNTGINANNMDIGRLTDTYFNGLIDDVRIYNKTLSKAEARRIYDWGPPPVAHWAMDEGSGTSIQDLSENANTGTITNATWANASKCKFGSCLSFDGSDDYVNCGTGTRAAIGQGNLSVSMWVYLDSAADNTTRALMSFYVSNGKRFEIYISANGDDHMEVHNDINNAGDLSTFDYLATALDTQNKWTQWTLTFSWTTASVYKNGRFVASEEMSFSFGTLDPGATLRIGSIYYSGVTNYNWLGKLDDVMVYDYALTQRQIAELYGNSGPNEGKSPVNSTAGYWNMDDGEGTVAEDSSGLANDLTLSAESWTMSAKYGGAWNGLGTNWLSKADDADFDFTASEDFSISTWFKSDSAANPASGVEYLADKRSASAGYSIYMDTGGDIIFGVDDYADSTWEPDDSVGDIGKDYYDNTWHHFVGVKTGTSKLEAYVDGKKIQTKTGLVSTATLANSALLYLGDSDGIDNGDEFNGDLDDVKIFRFAMSPEDVLMEYNQGKAVQMGGDPSDAEKYCPPGSTSSCTAPIAHWKMDEGADGTCTGGTNDVCDTSSSANDGAVTGATWKNAASCKFGSCLSFDGATEYVNCGDLNNATEGITGLTVSAWVKAGLANNDSSRYIIGKEGTGNDTFRLVWNSAEDVYFIAYHSSGNVSGAYTDGIPLNHPDVWYHVVGVYDGVVVKVYVNGVVGATQGAMTAVTFASTLPVTIGSDSGGSANSFWNGLIDDVMVYNRALTEGEIAWLYNKGKPAGYWKFNEGQGTTAKDSTTNNKPGTLAGGAAWTTSGKFNSAIDFDGSDDYVDIGASGLTAIKAVSLWVKPDSVAVTEEPLDLNGTAYVKITNGVVTGEGFTSPTIYVNGKQGSTLTAGSWNHILISGTAALSATDLDIGRLDAVYFNGKIDEVKLFNYQPTAEQVKIDYNQGAAVRF